MLVVITVDGDKEGLKANALIALLGIPLALCNLSNQPIIHFCLLLSDIKKTDTHIDGVSEITAPV